MAVADQTERETGGADGRRARRDRGRAAVIDALYELLREGRSPVTTDDIVERSGVSLSSIFRYFTGIDDLQQQTIEHHFARHAGLFEVPAPGEGTRAERIRTYVEARTTLHEAIAPIARLARVRAREQPTVAASLEETRQRFARQVRTHFAPEVATRTPALADDLVAVVASLTSFEAWDLLVTTHGRSTAQVRRAWTTALDALL